MLTDALSKIPAQYHERLRDGLLIVALVLIMFGFMDVADRKIMSFIFGIILLALGLFCLFSAFRITQISGRYKKYMVIIKGNDKFFIQEIADITRQDEEDVMNDLENMISSGYIKDCYIDYRERLLISRGS